MPSIYGFNKLRESAFAGRGQRLGNSPVSNQSASAGAKAFIEAKKRKATNAPQRLGNSAPVPSQPASAGAEAFIEARLKRKNLTSPCMPEGQTSRQQLIGLPSATQTAILDTSDFISGGRKIATQMNLNGSWARAAHINLYECMEAIRENKNNKKIRWAFSEYCAKQVGLSVPSFQDVVLLTLRSKVNSTDVDE